MDFIKLDSFVRRLDFIRGDRLKHHWGPSLGWSRSLISRIFSGEQLPNAEYLAALTLIERVNLTWLLTGDGPPYLVLPPPNPQDLVLGTCAHYYLFDRPDGIHPPLVCVRNGQPAPGEPAPPSQVTVYNGSPEDLVRAVEWLLWKKQTVYLAEDSDGEAARLRTGLASNQVLIHEGRGLLERGLSVLPLPRMVLTGLVEERANGYWTGARSPMDAEEYEWVMRWRELDAAQRDAMLLILRGLGRGD